ncbi:MFS transporter [Candidatus Azambacteria bacterium]|nr:MFS transporter [Candidatus Azambacteria bacterium]
MPFKNINPVVRVLIYSDILILGSIGLIAPVFAVFITEQIQGATIKTVGIAVGIYWLVHMLEIPIGRYLDRTDGEHDDYAAAIIGGFLGVLVPFLYMFASLPWHIFALQAFHGFARAIALPPWYALFTRHIDKAREGFDWSVANVTASLSAAGAGFLSGWIADAYGFRQLFFVAGIVYFIGAVILVLLYPYVKPRVARLRGLPYRRVPVE